MVRFVDEAEVHFCMGAILRLAADHPVVGPRLAAAETVLKFVIHNPDCELTVALDESHELVLGPSGTPADVTLTMSADALDRYWRGEYDLVRGLALGDIIATGRVSRVLKVLPAVNTLFPAYRALVRTGRTQRRQPSPVAVVGATARSEES